MITCPECDGSGEVHSHNPKCPACVGSGMVSEEKARELEQIQKRMNESSSRFRGIPPF